MTASYLRHSRGESFNSLIAKEEGRMPASYWAKQIGKGVTASDIQKALGTHGEYHHTGKYASRTPFYSAEDFDRNADLDEAREAAVLAPLPDPMELIFAARDARRAVKETKTYRIAWAEWYGNGRRKTRYDYTFEGEATIDGNWIKFTHNGQAMRKSLGGNWITVKEVVK